MMGMDDAAAAMILSGAMSSAGAMYANRNNAALAQSQLDYQKFVNDVNWAIAANNNATQIEMADTAHQREVSDLRRAGLNPILSAGGNGASVPSLTTPSGHVVGAGSPYSNPLEGAATSAKGVARFFGQQYRAQLDALKADASVRESEADIRDYDRQIAFRDNKLDQESYLKQSVENALDLDALRLRTGVRFTYNDNGDAYINFDDKDKWYDAAELRAERLTAAEKDAANANWRNNVRSVFGAAADVATSASALGRGYQAIKAASGAFRRYSPRSSIITY